MSKILKSVEGGMIGFEQVKEWIIKKDDIGFMFITEKDPDGKEATFTLTKASSTKLEGFSDETYFVTYVSRNFQDSTINTKAPVIISGGTIQQSVSLGGQIQVNLKEVLRVPN